MFGEVFLFELRYRFGRKVTYAYFFIVLILSFLVITGPNLNAQGSLGQTAANSPYVITIAILVLTFVFTVITSAVVGVSVIRDFDHRTESILYSTRMTKSGYLLGRFTGSLLTTLVILSAIPIGLMLGYALAQQLPWDAAISGKSLLPFNLWHFVQPFFMFTVVNAFVTGALFFLGGTVGRSQLFIYLQGVAIIIAYQISLTVAGEIGTRLWAAIIDPFGLHTFVYLAKYWSASEQNTLLLGLTSGLLYNRAIWIAVGIISLVIAVRFFEMVPHEHKSGPSTPEAETRPVPISVPAAVVRNDSLAFKFFRITADQFKMIWKEVPFIVILISGSLILAINFLRMRSEFNTEVIPTTSAVLNVLNTFNIFIVVIVVFCSGELVWKERDHQMNQLTDALPVPSTLTIFSKSLSVILTGFVLLVGLMLVGILFQAVNSEAVIYYEGYFESLFLDRFTSVILITVFCVATQSVVNSKFLGFTICVALFFLVAMADRFGLDNDFLKYGSGGLGGFSDMNGFGHFTPYLVLLRIYWIGPAFLLLLFAVILYPRGNVQGFGERWALGKSRAGKYVLLVVALTLISSVIISAYVGVKSAAPDTTQSQMAAVFTQSTGVTAQDSVPKIVNIDLRIELFPGERRFLMNGTYHLTNTGQSPVSSFYIQDPSNTKKQISFVASSQRAAYSQKVSDGTTLIRYREPLLRGDSANLDFIMEYRPGDFENFKDSNPDIIYNGSVIDFTYLPVLTSTSGIQSVATGSLLASREKTMQDRRPPINSGAKVYFSALVGTSIDQRAVAPGILTETFDRGTRRYFQFKSQGAISPFISIFSARYQQASDQFSNNPIKVFYHPDHAVNVQTILRGVKDGLDYHSKILGAFAGNLYVVEFPNYKINRPSAHGIIPFSEANVFTLAPGNELWNDMSYYLTVAAVSSQYWQHMVPSDDRLHQNIVADGLATYFALMTIQRQFGKLAVSNHNRRLMDAYLRGRSLERGREKPLADVSSSEQYIFGSKAGLAYYVMQDFLGEDAMNSILRAFYETCVRENKAPQIRELTEEIRKATPDSLQYMVDDLLTNITLFDNRLMSADYQLLPGNNYDISIQAFSQKFYVDSLGNETSAHAGDWLDIGVFGTDSLGSEVLVHQKRYHFAQKRQQFSIRVSTLPTRVVIDPVHKVIDKKLEDNSLVPKRYVNVGNVIIN